MKCRLTGTEGKPVAAHIVPRAFYEIDQAAGGPLQIISNTEGFHPRRSHIGIYDKTIVTEEGERRFSPWDDYATELLLNQQDRLRPIQYANRTVAFSRKKYDYKLLKLFGLSLIWRAGVSSHPFFDKVRLGKHEAEIRRHLLTSNPGEPECYSVIFSMWSDQIRGLWMMDPFRERYAHVNFYRSYVGNYICYVKVDKRPTPISLRHAQLSPDSALLIIARELTTSKELPIMKALAERTFSERQVP